MLALLRYLLRMLQRRRVRRERPKKVVEFVTSGPPSAGQLQLTGLTSEPPKDDVIDQILSSIVLHSNKMVDSELTILAQFNCGASVTAANRKVIYAVCAGKSAPRRQQRYSNRRVRRAHVLAPGGVLGPDSSTTNPVLNNTVEDTLLKFVSRDENDEFEVAIRQAEHQLRLAEFENDELSRARAWFSLGSIHHARAQDIQENIALMNLSEAEENNESNGASDAAESVIGYNIAKALNYYCKSALVTKKLGDYESCGAIYGCIGNVLHLLGEFEEAIRFHSWECFIVPHNEELQRWKAAHRYGDEKGEFRAIQNIGNEYANLSNFDKAIEAARLIAVRMNDAQRSQRCQRFILQIEKIRSEQ
ncbi:unnamed protein product [Heligmosomoides polygyrus]|uniref:TPR_REGION domain-containing protein n=1 Tax=Heligmosomoides polygyrus TaxID=6339 RepID=A0A183FT84_HELPZ|nr:unnamed protein product [Heligmosomoides polygyrus]